MFTILLNHTKTHDLPHSNYYNTDVDIKKIKYIHIVTKQSKRINSSLVVYK